MPHLRLVHENKLTQVAGSASHPTLNDFKSKTSTGTSFTLTTSSISGDVAVIAHLPEHNGSITMTISTPSASRTETTVTGSNAQAGYGGGKYVAVYLTGVAARTSFSITFSQSVKVSRFIVGNYWSPKYNIPYGISVGYQDLSTQDRLAGGDLYTNPGPRHKTVSFELEYLHESDKFNLFKIFKSIGKVGCVFVSAFPQDPDQEKEQMYSIYGKFSDLSQIVFSQYTRYTSSIDIEEF